MSEDCRTTPSTDETSTKSLDELLVISDRLQKKSADLKEETRVLMEQVAATRSKIDHLLRPADLMPGR